MLSYYTLAPFALSRTSAHETRKTAMEQIRRRICLGHILLLICVH
ncbi:hypothetical protein SELSPUOL_01663 [Selenomonas sputigena ATCC 35185]|uniref:Uncharacterized protein n=1 Tax=Selenomonas sputigena (strain ATCC 35185 / DSM 20758 / CCUG 44933 / VPI D19B-28) TaxID=546271 RepID=C9LW11_SELS3|nr:hypothetical protein SELSPUOL_01663 [Selenomonas sputigena ATCC 35185]